MLFDLLSTVHLKAIFFLLYANCNPLIPIHHMSTICSSAYLIICSQLLSYFFNSFYIRLFKIIVCSTLLTRLSHSSSDKNDIRLLLNCTLHFLVHTHRTIYKLPQFTEISFHNSTFLIRLHPLLSLSNYYVPHSFTCN